VPANTQRQSDKSTFAANNRPMTISLKLLRVAGCSRNATEVPKLQRPAHIGNQACYESKLRRRNRRCTAHSSGFNS
jgi:hypothetical protein